ncbi:hypothetical protein A2U01_0064174 [Trifolium medium]|uniref:Uncharacterized protein n=1 Tax=Trifolium medium TaxID=97028 RepID=A0A392S3I0_9FABA|nr:hypothetical protein [Trifolium medium]
MFTVVGGAARICCCAGRNACALPWLGHCLGHGAPDMLRWAQARDTA